MTHRWHVVQIHPVLRLSADDGAERTCDIGREIAKSGMPAYMPIERVKVVRCLSNGRRAKVDRILPLFPGYLFAQFNASADLWKRIPQIDGVQGMPMCEGMPIPVPEDQMATVRFIEAEVARTGRVRRENYPALCPGRAVRIIDPVAFSGLFGTVKKVMREWIIVEMDLFGRPTPLTLGPGQVEALPATACKLHRKRVNACAA